MPGIGSEYLFSGFDTPDSPRGLSWQPLGARRDRRAISGDSNGRIETEAPDHSRPEYGRRFGYRGRRASRRTNAAGITRADKFAPIATRPGQITAGTHRRHARRRGRD